MDATPLIEATGGVARYTWELARALGSGADVSGGVHKAGVHECDEVWLVSDQDVKETDSALSPHVHWGRPPANFLERRWWSVGLPRELRRLKADVFHGTDFAIPYRSPCAAVMTIHDLSPWKQKEKSRGEVEWQPDAEQVRKRMPRMLRANPRAMVITPSEAVRREVIEHVSLPGELVQAVPLAAGEIFRPPDHKAAQKRVTPNPYIVFVGTLEPRKNVAGLIEAWREARRGSGGRLDLVLAGRVRRDFRAPEPEPGLHLLGAVPDEDLPGLYGNAVAVAYPSFYEGFGLPVLEAMACGALVVTSRDPAICEVTGVGKVRDRSAAIHVDVHERGALAKALTEVARNSDSFAGMRERALARAGKFSWARTARETRDVYLEAMELRAGAGLGE